MSILPTDTSTTGADFPFGSKEARAQRDQYKGDAKELINGAKLDSDDGPIIPASRTAKGQPVIQYGKKVKLV